MNYFKSNGLNINSELSNEDYLFIIADLKSQQIFDGTDTKSGAYAVLMGHRHALDKSNKT